VLSLLRRKEAPTAAACGLIPSHHHHRAGPICGALTMPFKKKKDKPVSKTGTSVKALAPPREVVFPLLTGKEDLEVHTIMEDQIIIINVGENHLWPERTNESL